MEDKVSERHLCICADRRVETHSTGSETIFKFRKISNQFAALYAGTVSRADELIEIYIEHIGNIVLPRFNAIEELRKPPQTLKRRLVEEYVHNTLAMSYEEFLSKGPTLPVSLYEGVASDISRMQIDCQLILAPIPPHQHNFFTVDITGCVFEEQNFATIGSGASNANAWLHYRSQHVFMEVDRTILHTWEAKKFAENAPGVGKQTTMIWIDHESLQHHILTFEQFDKYWKRFGPRSTEGSAKSIELRKHFSQHGIKWSDTGIG